MEKEVGVSLSDILEMDFLKEAVVLAGRNGLSRIVVSVNVMEAPDIADCAASEQLLVTTAYSLKHDVFALKGLITMLNDANVSGLGIKLRRYIEEVPAEVIEIANRLSFPIFEIPQNISFSDIITSTLTMIVNNQTNVLQETHNLHQSLTSTMLRGGTLQDICNILYHRFGNSVAINSDFLSSFVIHAANDKYRQIYQVLQNDKGMRRLDAQWEGPFSFCRVENELLGDIRCDRIMVPIYSNQIQYGHIYIWEDNKKINSLELSAIESITSLIALNIMQKLSMIEMENNHKSGFLEDLLSSNSHRQQRALSKARFYDFHPRAAHQVVVVRQWKEKRKSVLDGKNLFSLNTGIIGILRPIVEHASIKILYVNNDSNIVILCEVPSGRSRELQDFLEKLSEHIMQEYLSDRFVIGVGRRYENSSDLYRSYGEARRATSCSHMANNNIVFYENMGINRLLSFESIQNESELFCDEMLRPLLDYDKEKASELVKTLSAYFKCKGNLTRLAEELNVHYNTIVYRMQRIRDLTGFNLDYEHDLLNLQIALKIYEIKCNE